MRQRFIRIIALGLCVACASVSVAAGAANPRAQAGQLVHSWSCTTTNANGTEFPEYDTIEPLGAHWLHGTARPFPGASQPFYDYYLGDVNGQRVYIQVDPSQGYFVGVSPRGAFNGSTWTIVFPREAQPTRYVLTESPRVGAVQQFRIAYSDLTQVCNVLPSPVAAAPPYATSWTCNTSRTGEPALTEDLSVSELQPGWRQGVARGSDGQTVYEFNQFSAQSERVFVEINASTGAYAIATSLSQSLNRSSWTVVFPALENGYTFDNVSPTEFTTIFADGSQVCTRRT